MKNKQNNNDTTIIDNCINDINNIINGDCYVSNEGDNIAITDILKLKYDNEIKIKALYKIIKYIEQELHYKDYFVINNKKK